MPATLTREPSFRRPRFRRVETPPPFQLTARDLAILHAVARFRFLSSTLIIRLIGGSPRFHRAASQERLVDQPYLKERRREAAMVGPVRHHRNSLSLDRPQTSDRGRGSSHAIDRATRADGGRSALRPQANHAPRCAVKEPQRALEPLLIPRSRSRGCFFRVRMANTGKIEPPTFCKLEG